MTTTTRNEHEESVRDQRNELLRLVERVPEDVFPVLTAYMSGLVNGRSIGIMSQKEG